MAPQTWHGDVTSFGKSVSYISAWLSHASGPLQVDQSQLKILVVDDDPEVLSVACASLEADGYTVLRALNAPAALQLLQENADVALLFTDIVMPGYIDGFDLAERAKQLHPGLRVLYTSGYLKDEGVWEGSLLVKPWRTESLRDAVKDALA
jgi:CheY-like chemotaxis protein